MTARKIDTPINFDDAHVFITLVMHDKSSSNELYNNYEYNYNLKGART